MDILKTQPCSFWKHICQACKEKLFLSKAKFVFQESLGMAPERDALKTAYFSVMKVWVNNFLYNLLQQPQDPLDPWAIFGFISLIFFFNFFLIYDCLSAKKIH